MAALAGAATLALTTLGLSATPAAAAPEGFISPVTGEIAIKGSPSAFNGVTIAGTFDEVTGDLVATASFPRVTRVQENNPAPGTNAEVVLDIDQPTAGTGTVSGTGEVTLNTAFRITIISVTLVNQTTGDRTPIPLGTPPERCEFTPINVELVGTASGDPLVIDVEDPEFTIPGAPTPTSCGPLAAAIEPAVAGSGNSAKLSFTISSTSAQVEAIFQATLGRSADEAGLAFWAARLEGGESLTSVASRIARSREGWRNAVRDSYQIALGRNPDAAGLQFWTEALLRDQDQTFLIGRLLSSPEADFNAREAHPGAASANEAFVRDLYLILFGRQAEASGLAFWTNQLNAAPNQAIARTQLAQRLYRSTETVRFAVNNASVEVCGVPASGSQATILSDAFRASNFHTRVLLAIASVTPCPAPT